MKLSTAQTLIRDPSARYAEQVEAAMTIAADPTSTRDDLLACIRRNELAAELACTRLNMSLSDGKALIEQIDGKRVADSPHAVAR